MMGLTSLQNQIRPPTQDPVVADTRILTDVWLRYFNNLYQLLTSALQKGISLPSLTTTQRDADPTYAQQRWILNTTANQVQININGTWYYTTLTAA